MWQVCTCLCAAFWTEIQQLVKRWFKWQILFGNAFYVTVFLFCSIYNIKLGLYLPSHSMPTDQFQPRPCPAAAKHHGHVKSLAHVLMRNDMMTVCHIVIQWEYKQISSEAAVTLWCGSCSDLNLLHLIFSLLYSFHHRCSFGVFFTLHHYITPETCSY